MGSFTKSAQIVLRIVGLAIKLTFFLSFPRSISPFGSILIYCLGGVLFFLLNGRASKFMSFSYCIHLLISLLVISVSDSSLFELE